MLNKFYFTTIYLLVACCQLFLLLFLKVLVPNYDKLLVNCYYAPCSHVEFNLWIFGGSSRLKAFVQSALDANCRQNVPTQSECTGSSLPALEHVATKSGQMLKCLSCPIQSCQSDTKATDHVNFAAKMLLRFISSDH